MAHLPHAVPLSRTLGACARELSALAARCEELQTGLAPALRSGAAIEEAQALDLLTQSLAAVAGYLGEVSAELPAELTIDPRDAAAKVPLAEMARRLVGMRPHAAPESGELEMFGGPP